MTRTSPPPFSSRPLVAVGLKMYFGIRQTVRWAEEIVAHPQLPSLQAEVDIVVIPTFVALESVRRVFAGRGVALGAQNVFWENDGPYTGEISPPMLAEAGCSFVEIGHAERRRLFGEDDRVVGLKARAAVNSGLTPLICVGEDRRGTPEQAAVACKAQATVALQHLPSHAPVVLAYEPVWAIGAAEPASQKHINSVAEELRAEFVHRGEMTRVVYGGTAGPGTFDETGSLDGLFLGRRAHCVEDLFTVLAEVAHAHA